MDKKNNIKSAFSTRASKVGSFSITTVIIVVAIAVVINLLAGLIPTRYTRIDLSHEELFTISDETKAVLADLDEDITLYWMVRQGTEDYTIGMLLDSYAGMSDHIKVVHKDPDIFPTFAETYTDASISNLSVIAVCGDKARYVDYYDLYESSYNYATYYETGVTDSYFVGETAITSAISYLMDDYTPTVYYTFGHGESTLPASYTDAIESQNIILNKLSMANNNGIPEDAQAIIIFNPASDIAEAEDTMLRDYLAAGGKLIYISSLQNGMNFPRLDGIMADRGVTRQEGIMIEGDANRYAWGTPYYLRPSMSGHEITKALDNAGYSVLLPIAQGLNVAQPAPSGVTVVKLLTTSDKAYSKLAGMNITTYEKEAGDVEGKFVLAALITNVNEGSDIIWVASDSIADDTVSGNSSGANQDFFINCVNWLCGKEESSLEIHSKLITQEFMDIDEGTASLLSVIFVAVVPLIVMVIGIVVIVRRKRR